VSKNLTLHKGTHNIKSGKEGRRVSRERGVARVKASKGDSFHKSRKEGLELVELASIVLFLRGRGKAGSVK